MSAAACILVTVYLCVGAPYQPVVRYVTFAPPGEQPAGPSEADIQKVGVEINISSSDVITFSSAKGLDKLCVDAGCLYYRKSCNDVQTYCAYKYDFVLAKNDTGAKLELDFESNSIVYKSATQLKAAEENIFLQIPGGAAPTDIPLSRLKSSASFDAP